MLPYLIKRIFIFLPTLMVISLVAFVLRGCGSGDPLNELLPPQGEGLDGYQYRQDVYYLEARRLGLDRPMFYFDFTSKAYPDTLQKIVDRDKIATLKKMIGHYGNWPLIEQYYNQIGQLERSVYNWPDTIGKNEQINIKKTINQLYLCYREKRINSLLPKINREMDGLPFSTNPFLADSHSKIEKLQEDYRRVITMPDQAKLYTPVFRWNGFDNQYHNWLCDFIKGDFGVSYFNGQPVTQKIKTAAEWTFIINIFSIFFTFLLSIPIGVFAAKYQGQFFDRFSSVTLFFLYSVPTFWMATMLVVFFTTPQYGMQFFASIGLGDVASDAPFWERFWERAGHLVLPIFCITYGSLAFISRQVRGGMLTVIRQDYVRTARAKGLPENKVIWHHAFRNSLFPLITIFSLVLPATLTGSVIVEVIFNIPGMGRLLLNSIFTSDWPIVITVLMLVAILTMLGTLLADLLFALVDPRVKFNPTDVSR